MKRKRNIKKDNVSNDDDFQPPLNIQKRRQTRIIHARNNNNTDNQDENDFQPPLNVQERRQTRIIHARNNNTDNQDENDFQPPLNVQERSQAQTTRTDNNTSSSDNIQQPLVNNHENSQSQAQTTRTDNNTSSSDNIQQPLVRIYEKSQSQTKQADPSTEDLLIYDPKVADCCGKAILNYEEQYKLVGFNESLKNTLKWLEYFTLEIQEKPNQAVLEDLLNVLNGNSESPFEVEAVSIQNSKQVRATGLFYMYGMARKHACKIFVFSTRRSPFTVTPDVSWCSFDISAVNRSDIPTIAVLEHKDSYLGRSSYYVLKQNDGSVISETPKVKNEDHEHFFATKIQDNYQRARAERIVFTPEEKARINESIYNLVIQETKSKLQGRWMAFLVQAQRSESTVTNISDLIEEFIANTKKQLKTSIPNGVLPIVKEEMERRLTVHSPASNWVSTCWASYSKTKNFHIHQIIDDFKAEISNSDVTIPVLEELEEIDTTKEAVKHRMVSRTLKAVLKENVDYGAVLATLEDLQETCTRCMNGLIEVIHILMDMIIKGDIIRVITNIPEAPVYFDFKSITSNVPGLDVKLDMAIYDENQMQMIQDQDFFSYSSLSNLLTNCLNRKRVDSNLLLGNNTNDSKTNLYYNIIQKLDTRFIFSFTINPAIQEMVRQLSVNLRNMYDFMSVKKDIRTVMATLLKVHLCVGANAQVPVPPKQKMKSKRTKRWRLYNLEQIIRRRAPNMVVLKKMVVNIFSVSNYSKEVTSTTEETSSKEATSTKEEASKESKRATPSSAIPSSHLRALLAVSTMLCMSDSIIGEIKSSYVKKQIHKDKREDINDHSYQVCATIINALRCICLKKNSSMTPTSACGFRQLRNMLPGKHAKICVTRAEKNSPVSVKVDTRTLYSVFSKNYILYKDEARNPITSIHDISSKDNRMKETIFGNFFKTTYIRRLLKEQKLKPCYYFYFRNQYDVKFAGETNRKIRSISDYSCDTLLSEEKETGDIDNDAQSQIDKLVQEVKMTTTRHNEMKVALSRITEDKHVLNRNIKDKKKQQGYFDKILISKFNRLKERYNKTWKEWVKASNEIKEKRSQIYFLSRKSYTADNSKVDTVIRSKFIDTQNDICISGLDPGIVTTATLCSSTGRNLQAKLKYLAHPNGSYDRNFDVSTVLQLTAKNVNNAKLFNVQQHKWQKGETTRKKLNRYQVTRHIRTTKYHQKFYDTYRKQTGCKVAINFIGKWNGSKGLKGHARRSKKPMVARMKAIAIDENFYVDEHNTTITCSACLSPTVKQNVFRNGKWKELKGAVTCYNDECPRRVSTKQTTVNRDANGAHNIALAGFSCLMSKNGEPLPVFDRRLYKSNRYILYDE